MRIGQGVTVLSGKYKGKSGVIINIDGDDITIVFFLFFPVSATMTYSSVDLE